MSMYHYIPPRPELSGHVQYYWILDLGEYIPAREQHRLTPQGFIDIVFYFRDSYRLLLPEGEIIHPRAALYGQRTNYIDLQATGRVGLFSVTFTPVGVRDILHIPLGELSNSHYSLDDLLGKEGHELEERVTTARDHIERVACLENYLLQRLKTTNEYENKRMKSVVTRVLQSRGKLNVQALADLACLSKKQFERQFTAHVGLMPKQYSRVIRFLHAQELRNKFPAADLPTIAYHAGYYDAAHLAHDIKQLSGYTPGTLFKSPCFPEDALSVERLLAFNP